jgi:hypothetical protein
MSESSNQPQNPPQNPPQMASPEVCAVCSVKIQKAIGRDVVIFATGAHSTREVLHERVCRHVKDRPGCINKLA